MTQPIHNSSSVQFIPPSMSVSKEPLPDFIRRLVRFLPNVQAQKKVYDNCQEYQITLASSTQPTPIQLLDIQAKITIDLVTLLTAEQRNALSNFFYPDSSIFGLAKTIANIKDLRELASSDQINKLLDLGPKGIFSVIEILKRSKIKITENLSEEITGRLISLPLFSVETAQELLKPIIQTSPIILGGLEIEDLEYFEDMWVRAIPSKSKPEEEGRQQFIQNLEELIRFLSALTPTLGTALYISSIQPNSDPTQPRTAEKNLQIVIEELEKLRAIFQETKKTLENPQSRLPYTKHMLRDTESKLIQIFSDNTSLTILNSLARNTRLPDCWKNLFEAAKVRLNITNCFTTRQDSLLLVRKLLLPNLDKLINLVPQLLDLGPAAILSANQMVQGLAETSNWKPKGVQNKDWVEELFEKIVDRMIANKKMFEKKEIVGVLQRLSEGPFRIEAWARFISPADISKPEEPIKPNILEEEQRIEKRTGQYQELLASSDKSPSEIVEIATQYAIDMYPEDLPFQSKVLFSVSTMLAQEAMRQKSEECMSCAISCAHNIPEESIKGRVFGEILDKLSKAEFNPFVLSTLEHFMGEEFLQFMESIKKHVDSAKMHSIFSFAYKKFIEKKDFDKAFLWIRAMSNSFIEEKLTHYFTIYQGVLEAQDLNSAQAIKEQILQDLKSIEHRDAAYKGKVLKNTYKKLVAISETDAFKQKKSIQNLVIQASKDIKVIYPKELSDCPILREPVALIVQESKPTLTMSLEDRFSLIQTKDKDKIEQAIKNTRGLLPQDEDKVLVEAALAMASINLRRAANIATLIKEAELKKGALAQINPVNPTPTETPPPVVDTFERDLQTHLEMFKKIAQSYDTGAKARIGLVNQIQTTIRDPRLKKELIHRLILDTKSSDYISPDPL